MIDSNSPIYVLHVDDDEGVTEFIAAFLEGESDQFTVEMATSATEGLEHLATGDVDCIVSDYYMPGMDGIEFLKTVRERDPHLPCILFTGEGSEEIASEAISAGVTDYLQKKDSLAQHELLAHRIRNIVTKYRAQLKADETERWMSELAEATDDLLFLVSADWDEVLFVNSAYEELLGRSRAQLDDNPQDYLHAIHPADRERVMTQMEKVKQGEPADVEYRVITDEGSQRWIWSRADPIYDETGAVTRIAGVARDITDYKRRVARDITDHNRRLPPAS